MINLRLQALKYKSAQMGFPCDSWQACSYSVQTKKAWLLPWLNYCTALAAISWNHISIQMQQLPCTFKGMLLLHLSVRLQTRHVH